MSENPKAESPAGYPPTREPTDRAELLDLLLAATNDGIVDWNLVTGATYYNQRWQNMLGYEDGLVETPTLWRDLLHPEDQPKLEEQLRDHLELYWPFGGTVRMRERTGGWRWILCRGFARRNAEDKPVRMVITFADISGRVRAEEQQRALVSAIPDTMFRVSSDGVVIDLKLGPTHGPLWSGLEIGRSLADRVPDPAVVKSLLTAIQAAPVGGKLQAFEVSTTPAGGAAEFHEIRVIGSGEGEAVCIVRDITDQRSMERQLFQSQKLQAIGHLAAGIAHEINTPLQFVGDNIHFLQTAVTDLLDVLSHYQGLVHGDQSPCDEASRAAALEKEADADLEYVREHLPKGIARAQDGVERVTRIVRAMKAFSHPGEGTAKQMVNVNALIENTVIVATNEWRYVADLATELDPDLPPVPCIAGSLAQVVLNLVVNAAHAIGDVVAGGDKGRITVTTAQRGDQAEICVRDTGGGIPEAIRSKIFDPFFTTKPVGKGTGQGLAMAHATVIEHQGTIHFESEIGKGTAFVIRLPLIQDAGD
jgi:PAS domain S-box-containing protein